MLVFRANGNRRAWLLGKKETTPHNKTIISLASFVAH